MKLREISRFFVELDRHINFPVTVTLTGGAAAIVFGVKKVTQDIDFEVALHVAPKDRLKSWEELRIALETVAKSTTTTPEYSDDIDRWSSIALPGKKSRLWKKIGKVRVRIFDPAIWSVGKLSRYLSSDESDLAEVLSITKPDLKSLVRFWGKALGKSPPSPAQSEFKKHVDRFLDNHAVKIWGRKINGDELRKAFLSSARATTRVS